MMRKEIDSFDIILNSPSQFFLQVIHPTGLEALFEIITNSPSSSFHNICGAKGLKYSTRHTFSDDDLFLGLSLTVEDDADLATLASIESVAGIWPVLSVPRPSAVRKHIHADWMTYDANVP